MNSLEIYVENISKQFKDVLALDDVSMRFENGNLYGVIGPAGAGKTTLFRIMLDLLRANTGRIVYRKSGRDVRYTQIQENIAYMPQSQSLYSDLSVAEHLDFFRKLYGLSDADFEHKKRELLHLARLDEFADRPAGKLSGGMYKKLGLICALLRSPQIMLLDEPTNGVDPISRREFWDLLHGARNQGILVLITTAYMDEAERCNRVVMMERGRVLAVGAPEELLDKYNSHNFDELFLKRAEALDE
ncbi:MAG: ABC transporter ATP-binding protein [Alphaproteobacteria bacterium]|nr:ABC transporter ATP-binding protein [Alphaproteobacteria bacterium]